MGAMGAKYHFMTLSRQEIYLYEFRYDSPTASVTM